MSNSLRKMSHRGFMLFALFLSVVNGSLYDESQLNDFTVSRTSTLTVSSNVHKHGGQSLKWSWQPSNTLVLHLLRDPVQNKQLRRGGVKLWLYLVQNIHGNITVSFYTSFLVNYWRANYPECQFDISLEFKGWRAVWVGFKECRLGESMLPLYRMALRAPNGQAGEIYIDLLRIVRKKIRKQSRDQIVPPILGRVSFPRQFWQQTYRWSLIEPKEEIFNEIELNDDQFQKLKDIRLVRTRLREWFDGRKATYDFTGYFRIQWHHLKLTMKAARLYFKILNITQTKGFIQGPPLFSRNSEYGEPDIRSPELKFGFVMREVLLPLSFEYFFLTRKHEINRIIKEELPKLNNRGLSSRTVQKLLGYDKELMKVFFESSKLQVRHLSRRRLRLALNEVNDKRFQRILLLLNYIVDQGWQVGSALGSLDHEMNRSSKGFVTSIFLLRIPLMRAGKLAKFINIMKWYLELGEVYQSNFEYSGTTCDRMRTLMLYRLMCVIVMPEVTLHQSLHKLRDMDALKNWYENALSVNSGLGGVIKPDYTGYHHKSFYPNDYVLPALITAAEVVYLLRGTYYEIHKTRRQNLRNAINFMRILSVMYTIPNSVANTGPTLAKPELVCLIPAFAYLTISEIGSRDGLVFTREMSTQTINNLRVFLRMFNESDADVAAYLLRGARCSSKTSFVYTLGSLALIYRLKRSAKDLGIKAEQSPQGNWAKNFAALAIHRRHNWAVTVKGFNNFVWGHESSRRGNHYGLYQSYGQLIIANSDHALRAHDINRGWDWTRLPGTTTLRLPLEQLLLKRSRFYNPKDLCGAVSFQGTSRFKNGAFVMDFQRPDYGTSRGGKDTQFWFKKSVFFYDDLMVCLGSDINTLRASPVEIETTLFQNIGIIGEQVRSIRANGFELQITRDSRRFVWEESSAGVLMDVNSNGYYVPKAGKQNMNLWLGNQSSYDNKYKEVRTEGYFATACLKHGDYPQGMSYEYAILVDTTWSRIYDFACRQENLRGLPKYKVVQQNKYAHVVKFNNSPRPGLSTFAYSVFAKNAQLPGPLWIVGDPCVLMVEDGGTRLILAVSYPQLNFNSSKKLRTAQDVKEEELFYMKSQEKIIWVLLRESVNVHNYRVFVDGELMDPKEAVEHVRVYPDYPDAMDGSLVFFTKLVNGFTTEVDFRRILSTMS